MDKKRTINKFTVEGREEIHKQLVYGDYELLHMIMRNPVPYRSVEYNDNRVSLYVAQKGKCAVLGKILTFDEIHCHHKVPLSKGGKDNYANLIILHRDLHRYLHATDDKTLAKYETELNLNEKQKNKIGRLKELL
jgi:5-methylcytosine-specific restriction endonuclease McrA